MYLILKKMGILQVIYSSAEKIDDWSGVQFTMDGVKASLHFTKSKTQPVCADTKMSKSAVKEGVLVVTIGPNGKYLNNDLRCVFYNSLYDVLFCSYFLPWMCQHHISSLKIIMATLSSPRNSHANFTIILQRSMNINVSCRNGAPIFPTCLQVCPSTISRLVIQ